MLAPRNPAAAAVCVVVLSMAIPSFCFAMVIAVGTL